MIKSWFFHLSLVIANLKHIFQSAQILAIYIENSVNMCFEMSVFADRRRDDRLSNSSMLIDVVESAIAFLVISTNATNDNWLFNICWLFKTTCITFVSDDNDFILSKLDDSRRVNRSKFRCRRRFSEFINFLFNAFENRFLDFTIADSWYFKYFNSCSIQFIKNEKMSEIYKRLLNELIK